MIEPGDSIWIAYVISNHNGEIEYLGTIPPKTGIDDVKWPEWSKMLNDCGEDRYKLVINPLDLFLNDWIKSKLRNIKLTSYTNY